MNTVSQPHLPATHTPDESLRDLIPTPHDWRTFARWPDAPHLAIDLLGQAVVNTTTGRSLTLTPDQKTGRRNFKFVFGSGPSRKETSTTVARAVCSLAKGPPPSSSYEAHHGNAGKTVDAWWNLTWVKKTLHQKISAKERRARKGRAAPNPRLTEGDINYIIETAYFSGLFTEKQGITEIAKKVACRMVVERGKTVAPRTIARVMDRTTWKDEVSLAFNNFFLGQGKRRTTRLFFKE